MTLFRPCIDLHQGSVKQIVGGSLNDSGAQTNFVSEYDAAYYASLYQQHNLTGGHVVALGAGNEAEVKNALEAWPKGMQYGGGVQVENATRYLDMGATHVIVTSALFEGAEFSFKKLDAFKKEVGADKLVVDLSCRKQGDGWFIATNRWQTVTSMEVNAANLKELASHCAEFLIHAADVEGLQSGIDEELVTLLGKVSDVPVTYAGGARNLDDLKRVHELSNGNVDLTIGSALDIFGGRGVTLTECIKWNSEQN